MTTDINDLAAPKGGVLVASGMSAEDTWHDLGTVTVAIGDGLAGAVADVAPDPDDWARAAGILADAGYDEPGEPYWDTRARLWVWLL